MIYILRILAIILDMLDVTRPEKGSPHVGHKEGFMQHLRVGVHVSLRLYHGRVCGQDIEK